MYHKLKKDVGALKVGDYLDVHEDQKDDLVNRGIIEDEGVGALPDAPAEKPKGRAKVSSTADIIANTEETKKEEK